MLPGERNPDDGDPTEQCGNEMPQGNPPAADHDPEDVSNQGGRFHSRSLLPVDHLPTERPEGKGSDPESGNSPGNSDNGDEGEDSGDDPAGRHDQPPKQNPNDISDETEGSFERSDLDSICIGHADLASYIFNFLSLLFSQYRLAS